MTVRTTFLLLSLVAIALSNPVTHSGNVTLNEPLYAYFGPWNLESDANITINHTVPVIVCVVNAQFGSPNETQYSDDVCTWFYNLTVSVNHQTTLTVHALYSNYSVGVYFANPEGITKDNNTFVGIEVSGNTCPDGQYYASAEKQCKVAVVLEGLGNATIPVTFPGKETQFFVLNNPERVPTLTFKLVDEAENGQPEDYIIMARYNGNPDGNAPADYNGTVSVVLPLPGKWVFAVYRSSDAAGNARVGVSGTPCTGAGWAAPDGNKCVQIPAAAPNLNLTITAVTGNSPTQYYWINATKENIVWVSVTTFNQSYIPKLFVAQGQLPTTDGLNAQIKDCNRDYCTTVHSIKYNTSSAEPQDWFVTIQTVLHAGNITVGVWFNSDCVTGCTQNNRGQCLPDGTCQCYLDFTGIDCSISEGLGAPYIVLIIIASLVVASAVVGFVAWAYMRRKRNDYETLS